MVSYRPFYRFVMLFWVTLLSLAILCAQGTRLHIHFVDCGKIPSTNSEHMQTPTGHHQHAKVHLVSEKAHWMHTSDGLSVLDMSPEGLLTKSFGIALLLAIFVSLLILYVPVLAPLTFRRQQDCQVKVRHQYNLSPPLRAPPTPHHSPA
jgi:hypothetical protein